jgi:hypothetical protein
MGVTRPRPSTVQRAIKPADRSSCRPGVSARSRPGAAMANRRPREPSPFRQPGPPAGVLYGERGSALIRIAAIAVKGFICRVYLYRRISALRASRCTRPRIACRLNRTKIRESSSGGLAKRDPTARKTWMAGTSPAMTTCVIASDSEAIQRRGYVLDCFVAFAPRNDEVTYNPNRFSALPCAIRSRSAALTGICSKNARAAVIDWYGWSAENMMRSTPTSSRRSRKAAG